MKYFKPTFEWYLFIANLMNKHKHILKMYSVTPLIVFNV